MKLYGNKNIIGGRLLEFKDLITSSSLSFMLPVEDGSSQLPVWPSCLAPAMFSHNRLLPSGIINQNNLPSLSHLGHGALSQKQRINITMDVEDPAQGGQCLSRWPRVV